MHYSEKLKLAKSNMKATWGIINDLIGKKTKQLPKENFTINHTVIKTEDTPNTFNSYFVKLGPNLANKFDRQSANFTKFLPEPNSSSPFFNPTNPTEIIRRR